MSFINDLNKMVNTINKVDKMLTEKPKRPRTKSIRVSFTQEELDYLYRMIKKIERDYDVDEKCQEIHKKLLKKLN